MIRTLQTMLARAHGTEIIGPMRRIGVVACLCLSAAFAKPAASQSRCADCHFANPGAPAANRLADWDHSLHSRNSVECEKCHGGDATTFEPFLAHRGILNSTNPASPVNRRNQLDGAYQQTEVPLIQVPQAGHTFVYDELKERL
jgi:Cytochrome c554 and c-prime